MSEIDMQAVCDDLKAMGIPAFVQQTGGGVATIYAGEPYTDPIDDEWYPAVAGPGWFDGPGWIRPFANPEDFYIGPDNNVGDAQVYVTAAKLGNDPAVIATTIALAVKMHEAYTKPAPTDG